MTSEYQQLSATFQCLSRFNHVTAIAGCDMQTTMPPGGSRARGEALAEMSVLQHQILTAPQIGELLQQTEPQELNDNEMQRAYQQASLLPEAKSIAGSVCEHAWRSQRPVNDWQGFAANLKQVVRLSREKAQLRADANGCSRYDALLDLYEPGMTRARLDKTFGELKSWLPQLLQQVVEKQAQLPQGPFAVLAQRQLGLSIMETLGFDFNHGRWISVRIRSAAACRSMFASPPATTMSRNFSAP